MSENYPSSRWRQELLPPNNNNGGGSSNNSDVGPTIVKVEPPSLAIPISDENSSISSYESDWEREISRTGEVFFVQLEPEEEENVKEEGKQTELVRDSHSFSSRRHFFPG